MRRQRWLLAGVVAIGFAAALDSACGSSAFTADTDASSDASPADVLVDQSAPDGTVGDAGPTALFCDSRKTAYLCADFDESDPRFAFVSDVMDTFFSVPTVDDGGAFGRQEGGASLPFSLAASLPALGDSGAIIEAQTQGTLASVAANHFQLEADLQFAQVGSFLGDYTLTILTLLLNGPSTTSKFNLGLRGNHVWLDVGTGSIAAQMLDLGNIPAPGWVHLRVDITFGGAGQVSASLGNASKNEAYSPAIDQTAAKLELGLLSFGYTGSLSLGYDNVVLFADHAGLPDGGIAVGDD